MKRAKGTYARVSRCNPVIKFFPLLRPRILFSNSSISSIYLNILCFLLCGLDRETWIIFERVSIHVKIGLKIPPFFRGKSRSWYFYFD